MTWQSRKIYFVALAALLFAISALWLIAKQITDSYEAENNRSQLETEMISTAIAQHISEKIIQIQLIQTIVSEQISPILRSNQLSPSELQKLQEILNDSLALSSLVNATGIISTDNSIISSASIENKSLLAPAFSQSSNNSINTQTDKDSSDFYISKELHHENRNSANLISKVNLQQLLKNINILNKNKNITVILFDNNLNILNQKTENPYFDSHITAIKTFLQSNQESSSSSINDKNIAAQINVRRISDSSLYMATINKDRSNLIAWKHNALIYISGCLLVLGLLLQILYSISRTKRLSKTLLLKESKLVASETRFRQMIEAMPIGLVLARKQDKLIIYINKPAAKILNMPQASALSKRAFDIYSDKNNFETQVNKVVELSTSQSIECILKRNNEEPFWANISISMVDVADTETLLIGIADISAQKELEAELKYQATTDYLSGLYNRAHFIHSSNQEIYRIKRLKKNASLLMLDIDHFKRVNDNFGHDAGDLVIQVIALTCKETLREIDILGRMGGEEFAALLPETSAQEALNVAERLRAAIENKRIKLKDGQFINITSSIGVTEVTEQDAIIDVALKRADVAMYSSKNNGRNQVQYFKEPSE